MQNSSTSRFMTLRRAAIFPAFGAALMVLTGAASSSHAGATARAAERDGPALARLGSCELESGAAIEACELGYRTFGRLDATRSNSVLVTTWFTGRSDDWTVHLGADGWLDTTRFHVVVVDAFGNGISSSPSNSPTQRGAAFPHFTIRDLVAAQHRLVTERLRLPRLHAVVGISMGGMQALEWGVAHPGYVQRVVAVAGTPRPGVLDRLVWSAALLAIEQGRGALGDSAIASHLQRLDVAVGTAFTSMPVDDYLVQLRAMLSHDVSHRHAGDMRATARALRPRLLLVWSPDDLLVTSDASARFARDANAETFTVTAPCGHLTAACETSAVARRVREFLEE